MDRPASDGRGERRSGSGAAPGSTYVHGYGARTVAAMAARTAEREAAFLLPHLRPGMRVLDAGCGPGTITLGLAAAVAPGEAVGLELSPAMVEGARALAAERGVANVRFEVGDLLALPFPDASFDAAFESAVLEHVPDPARAVAELRRMLAREVLRLRALVPPEQQYEPYVRGVVAEDGDPALPRTIGERAGRS
jgi:ubiquinone/menaquinone biosynthesis C-methylase UbiE